jgi:hypothetical protein
MFNLGDILKKRTSQSPIWRGVTAALAVEEANKIIKELFGDEIQKYAQAVYLKNEVLSIACLSSVVAQEVKINEKKIIEKIAKKFSQNIVKKINYLA